MYSGGYVYSFLGCKPLWFQQPSWNLPPGRPSEYFSVFLRSLLLLPPSPGQIQDSKSHNGMKKKLNTKARLPHENKTTRYQFRCTEHTLTTCTWPNTTSLGLATIIITIYPLTARVVRAPQMISQPGSSIFPCSPLPSGTWRTPGLSIP